MLTDKNKYKSSLSDLWNRVFGDSYDFIELIFKPEYKDSIICFAELDGEKAVSAFYLIRNTLKFENEFFDGYYLYAAATLPEYRKAGIMSRLINEAIDYCEKEKIDFISLVPSEESLYGYYSRFGFESAMYRYINRNDSFEKEMFSLEVESNIEKIINIRNKFDGNIISFHPSSFGYAADCLNSYGLSFINISDESYLLCGEDDDFSEFFSTKRSLSENEARLAKMHKEVTSPFALSFCESNDVSPYGMLYPVNERLKKQWKFTDIYMNIALD